jgi:hypothetical protein
MRPTGVEPATFGLKDRRSLGPRKDPLTTELRALMTAGGYFVVGLLRLAGRLLDGLPVLPVRALDTAVAAERF